MSEAVGETLSATEAPASMSFVQRIVNVFVAPSVVFQFLAGRPLWAAPLILMTLYSGALNFAVVSTSAGEAALKEQIMSSPQAAQMPEERMGTALAMGKTFAGIGALIFVPLITFVGAGILYILFSIGLGGEGTFKQTLAVYTHAGLIYLVTGLIGTSIVLMKGSFKSSTSLAAFLPFLEETSFVYKVLQGLDLFIMWQLAVASIGMAIIHRMTTKKAAIAIFSVYLVVVLVIAGIRQAMA